MNTLSRPKNSKQLWKSPRKRITKKHHRIHSSQNFSTTINRFSDMLSAILEKHNSIAASGLGPKSFDSTGRTLKSRNPFRNTASFIGEIQASTYSSKSHGPAASQQKRKKRGRRKIAGKLTS
jgi:hypothetical protein